MEARGVPLMMTFWQFGNGKICDRVVTTRNHSCQCSEANSIWTIRKFYNDTIDFLPIEDMVVFFRIFFSCHVDLVSSSSIFDAYNPKRIVSEALALIECIQKPNLINSPLWRMSFSHTVFWSLRACRCKGPTMWQAEPDALGFRLHREQGWIGPTNRRKGFPILEWRSITCAYTVAGAQSAVGSVVSWLDNTKLETYRTDHWNRMSGRLPPCGKDGGVYVAFCENLSTASHCWYHIWSDTLDMIDKLVSVKVSILIFAPGIKRRQSSTYFHVADT